MTMIINDSNVYNSIVTWCYDSWTYSIQVTIKMLSDTMIPNWGI